MIKTLTTSEAADRLMADENASWSYHGARAMVEYLEEIEESTGELIELDIVAIRCDYSEYTSAVEAAGDCGWKPDTDQEDEDLEELALDWLKDRTTVIEFWGGVIVQAF